MILSDRTLKTLVPNLVTPSDHSFVNPASIDIRIGRTALVDVNEEELEPYDIQTNTYITLQPLQFALIETYEVLQVPDWCALELRLKSSSARRGFNHSLAFWFDPGWEGIGTMEIFNQRSVPLELQYMERFAQVIVHRLDAPAEYPYNGRYQFAQSVEGVK